MKKLGLLLALWACMSASLNPAQQRSAGSGEAAPGPTRVLTLSEAVQIALKNNPAVGAADAYADAVRQGIKTAQGRPLPPPRFLLQLHAEQQPGICFRHAAHTGPVPGGEFPPRFSQPSSAAGQFPTPVHRHYAFV